MTIDEYNRLLQKHNRGKSAASEHDLQVACVNWFRLSYREYSDLLIAIPNGGYRAKSTARYMKAEGQKVGVPDLFLAVPSGKYHGLWIEMKNDKKSADTLHVSTSTLIAPHKRGLYQSRVHHSDRTREQREGNASGRTLAGCSQQPVQQRVVVSHRQV